MVVLGTVPDSLAAVAAEFNLGVDGAILRGSPPQDLVPVLPAYWAIRTA